MPLWRRCRGVAPQVEIEIEDTVKIWYHIIVSSVETKGAFNTVMYTVNLHCPAAVVNERHGAGEEIHQAAPFLGSKPIGQGHYVSLYCCVSSAYTPTNE